MLTTFPQVGRALVIGASISGLLAAQVLSRHFPEVIIIERDTLPPAGEPRKGVPQGRHAHVLLARGYELLNGFFPGLCQELVSQGAMAGDLSESTRWFSYGHYTRNFSSGLVAMQVSRPLLESAIQRRVYALPNVKLLENHDAAGPISAASKPGQDSRVIGLRVVDRAQGKNNEKKLDASLVVDCSGRGSRCLTWFDSLGYARPVEEHIRMGLTYTTRVFQRLPDHAQGQSPVVILPSANNRRAASMLAVEGSRWIVTLAGLLGEAAPTDLAGFIEFARSLDAPDCYDIVKTARPLGEGSQYKYPASQRRFFEKLDRLPEGLLVCGDAVCSFNPIYGQGMTTAASEAAVLDECLQSGLPGIESRFFKRVGSLLESPWAIAAGSDLVYPEVEGKRTLAMRLSGKYLERLLFAAREDIALNVAFQRVTNLMDPPASLFAPHLILRVLMGNLKRSQGS